MSMRNKIRIRDTKRYLNISTWIKTIQLVNQFKHGTLHFIIATHPIVKSCTADSIYFIKEYQTGLQRYLKQNFIQNYKTNKLTTGNDKKSKNRRLH